MEIDFRARVILVTCLALLLILTYIEFLLIFSAYFVAVIIVLLFCAILYVSDLYETWRSKSISIIIDGQFYTITDDPFPAITICNLNAANKIKYNSLSNYNKTALNFLCEKNNLQSFEQNNQYNISTRDIIRYVGTNCEDMIIDCFYGGLELNCKNVFKSYVTKVGKCCTFNQLQQSIIFNFESKFGRTFKDIGEGVAWNPETGYDIPLPEIFYPRKIVGNGLSMGLTLTLNADFKNYTCSAKNSIGFQVLVHKPTDLPDVEDDALLIPSGKEIMMNMNIKRYISDNNLRNLPINLRGCYFLDEVTIPFFRIYSLRSCKIVCEIVTTIEHCGCMSYYLPSPPDNNIRICNYEDVNCEKQLKTNIKNGVWNNTCPVLCLPTCNEFYYKPKLFYSQLAKFENGRLHETTSRMTEQELKESISVLHIFFESLRYDAFSVQINFGTFDLMSRVGGLLGTFFGFSVMTLAELILFFILMPIRKYFSYKRKQKRIMFK